MNKLVKAAQEAVKVAKCDHEFEYRLPPDLARVIAALSRYADDLDYTERPALGEYDLTTDIRTVCSALTRTPPRVCKKCKAAFYDVSITNP